jgi:hypothetical protein
MAFPAELIFQAEISGRDLSVARLQRASGIWRENEEERMQYAIICFPYEQT